VINTQYLHKHNIAAFVDVLGWALRQPDEPHARERLIHYFKSRDRTGSAAKRKRIGSGWQKRRKKRLNDERAAVEPHRSQQGACVAAVREDLASLVVREGVTVFLNMHNLTEAEKLCAQVGVIRRAWLH
jgi:hypothetical protein